MSLSCKLGWDQGTKGPLERGIFLGGGHRPSPFRRHYFGGPGRAIFSYVCVCLRVRTTTLELNDLRAKYLES